MIYRLTTAAVIFLFMVIIFSQILIPALRGTKLFPLFRREGRLKAAILDKNQEDHEKALETQIIERELEEAERAESTTELAEEQPAQQKDKLP